MRTPEEVIAELAPKYTTWKSSEKTKEKLRKEFLEAVTEFLKQGDLAEKVVTIEADDEDKARELAEKLYPLWTVDELRPTPEVDQGSFDAILVENPQFLPFTIEYDGKVWGRQIRSGSTFVDDERLMEEDPQFYWDISDYQGEPLIREIIAFTLGEEDPYAPSVYEPLEAFCEQKRDGKRALKPLEDLTPEQMAKLQAYIYEGKPSLSFPAPRDAT